MVLLMRLIAFDSHDPLRVDNRNIGASAAPRPIRCNDSIQALVAIAPRSGGHIRFDDGRANRVHANSLGGKLGARRSGPLGVSSASVGSTEWASRRSAKPPV